ncbi:MAG: hypothetical protein Q9216_006634, partial [Gyalolechia sp. 2 TL-2023]
MANLMTMSKHPAFDDWHVRRHEQRLEASKKGKLSSNVAEGPSTQSQSLGPCRQHAVNERSGLPRHRHGATDEIPIYSDEPVPRDSQAFWDTILTDAGTSTRVHQTSLARSPQVIVPSDSWLENNGSVRLSIRDINEDERNLAPSGGDPAEPLISPRSPESDQESVASTEIRSRLSPLSLPSLDGDENYQLSQSHRSSIETLDLQSLKGRNASVDVEANDPLVRPPRERGTDSQHAWPNQMDVDGPSDDTPRIRHISSISSLQDPEPGSIGMPFGAQARKAELAASRNIHAARSAAIAPMSQTESRMVDQSARIEHSQAHGRTRSGGLPRSRLHISEAAASSSQERRQTSTAPRDYEATIDQGDIYYSPRRRKKPYRRLSETSSFVTSDESIRHSRIPPAALASTNPFGSSPYDSSHTQRSDPRSALSIHEDHTIGSSSAFALRIANDFSSSPGRIRHHHHHYPPSPYDSPNPSQSRYSSSTYPNDMSPQSHDGSFGLPYLADTNTRDIPTLLPRRALSRLTTPTSSAARIPSSTNSILLPYADENNHLPGSSYRPSTPPPPPLPTSIPSTPTRIPIYNDNLPAHTQPQTPLGLPRHGLPRTSRNPYFFTAPARHGGGFRRGAADWAETAFGTPSRRSRGRREEVGVWGGYDGQENVSVEVEAARSERRRRREEERVGMEMERRLRSMSLCEG